MSINDKITKRRITKHCPRNSLSNSIDREDVVEAFEWYETICASYDELYSQEQRLKYGKFIARIEQILRDIHAERTLCILDIGCGTSEFLLFLMKHLTKCKSSIANMGVYYLGIDLSHSLLGIASHKLRSNIMGNVLYDLIAGDLSHPPIRDSAKFDAILMISTILSSYDYLSILNAYSRVYTRSKGVLVFTVLCKSYEDLRVTKEMLESKLKVTCEELSPREVLCFMEG